MPLPSFDSFNNDRFTSDGSTTLRTRPSTTSVRVPIISYPVYKSANSEPIDVKNLFAIVFFMIAVVIYNYFML
jgi:hypothetical protein